jgi:hypothetical protein
MMHEPRHTDTQGTHQNARLSQVFLLERKGYNHCAMRVAVIVLAIALLCLLSTVQGSADESLHEWDAGDCFLHTAMRCAVALLCGD